MKTALVYFFHRRNLLHYAVGCGKVSSIQIGLPLISCQGRLPVSYQGSRMLPPHNPSPSDFTQEFL